MIGFRCFCGAPYLRQGHDWRGKNGAFVVPLKHEMEVLLFLI